MCRKIIHAAIPKVRRTQSVVTEEALTLTPSVIDWWRKLGWCVGTYTHDTHIGYWLLAGTSQFALL